MSPAFLTYEHTKVTLLLNVKPCALERLLQSVQPQLLSPHPRLKALMSDSTKITRINLVTKRDYPEWYDTLYRTAKTKNVWQHIDPDGLDDEYIGNEPEPPSFKAIKERQMAAAAEAERANSVIKESYKREKANDPSLKESDLLPVPLTDDAAIDEITKRERGDYAAFMIKYQSRMTAYSALEEWVKLTVSRSHLRAVYSTLSEKEEQDSLQNVIRQIRAVFRPSQTSYTGYIRDRYIKVLERSTHGNEDVNKWLTDWNQAYAEALAEGIPEVRGNLATR